eukprot:CFRG3068T1
MEICDLWNSGAYDDDVLSIISVNTKFNQIHSYSFGLVCMLLLNKRRTHQSAVADEWEGYLVPEYKARRPKKRLCTSFLSREKLRRPIGGLVFLILVYVFFNGGDEKSLIATTDMSGNNEEYYNSFKVTPVRLSENSEDAVFLFQHGVNRLANQVDKGQDVAFISDELYPFRCANGESYFARSQYNDDYCDCEDGSDEPSTNACGTSPIKFRCNDKLKSIWLSQVGDGICDCCDGSDENVSVLLKCKKPRNCS